MRNFAKAINGGERQPGGIGDRATAAEHRGRLLPLNENGEFREEFGGTSVTVGGVAAKLLFISPDQINIQTPAVAPGRRAVVVRAPGGASAEREVTVTDGSPDILVITKQNYSGVDLLLLAVNGFVYRELAG
jgi:uncharacterized protein (TIGR03437 family)